MKSKAHIAGHPIHPMLIAFPIAFYTATVATLIVFTAIGNLFWYRVAMWTNLAGVVMAAVAAIPGAIDLFSLPRHSAARATGLRHAGFNVLALALFTISVVILYANRGTANPDAAAPLVLGILGVASTLVAGWLGWTLTQTHHVGIEPTRSDETINRELGMPLHEPSMPATYDETYRSTIRH